MGDYREAIGVLRARGAEEGLAGLKLAESALKKAKGEKRMGLLNLLRKRQQRNRRVWLPSLRNQVGAGDPSREGGSSRKL